MIETLRIEGLAIVDRVELEFGPGLNVLTGETGAGKSIVLGALSLLAGARSSARIVRDGSAEAVVEAIFRTDGLLDLERELAERGYACDDHTLVARRSVSRSGRSRARIAGQLVPVSALAEVFAGRLEISSQHDSQALLRSDVHGLLLDRMGGLDAQRRAVAEGFTGLRSLGEELERLCAEAQERARRRDFLRFQLNEIDAARLDADELEALRGERSRLAHATRLQEGGGEALALLAGDPQGDAAASAGDLLSDAARRLEELAKLDPELAALAGRLRAARDDVRDAAFDLERYASGIEADPARLAAADERLHQVDALRRKYGDSVEEILRFRAERAAELDGFETAAEREAEIRRERAERSADLAARAQQLSAGRVEAARRLGAVVQTSLRELALPRGRFAVALEPVAPPAGMPCGPCGNEAPEFRFSANAGEELRPLRAVASGGELSRVFLALKQALREADAGMVLVFDEVDAAIGGRTADRVGRKLAELAARHQVLCITHLPQIAAFASAHFRVEKRERGGRTRTRITRVEGTDRVEEIARMAGGESIGRATLEHARELLASRAGC